MSKPKYFETEIPELQELVDELNKIQNPIQSNMIENLNPDQAIALIHSILRSQVVPLFAICDMETLTFGIVNECPCCEQFTTYTIQIDVEANDHNNKLAS